MDFENLIQTITLLVTVASAVAAMTPTPAEGTRLWKFYKVIDFLALNVGRAKELGDRLNLTDAPKNRKLDIGGRA